MTQDQEPNTPTTPSEESAPPAAPSARGKALIVLVVALIFAVLIGIRLADGMRNAQPAGTPPPGESPAAAVPDPVTAYETALAEGRPIYVLFHSSTCPSCVEIEAAAARVLPEYADSVSFVDVYTDDPRARPLFSRFAFQYIPTSFFLAGDGSVVDQHTGVLNDAEMRERLDTLVDASENG
ncbi:MAG: hypothetical protein IBX63_00090 [Coriobacteriia bacterium]|nr:hypothetical protein [Coriobacteriia bacterium]